MTINIKPTSQFIEEAKRVHGDKYDYTPTSYTGSDDKVTILCPVHGEFKQKASTHLQHHGCPECGRRRTVESIHMSNNTRKLTTELFVQRAQKRHSTKYDYSTTKYINWKTKVEIICPIHGMFAQSPGKHIDPKSPTGCPKCANKQQTTEDFVRKATAKHGDAYDYSNSVYVNDVTKIKITCKTHGDFYQIPSNHHSLGHGCPSCKRTEASLRGVGGYNLKTIPDLQTGTLYCVHMKSYDDEYVKVGITKNNPHKRLRHNGAQIIVLRNTTGLLKQMYLYEQEILQRLSHLRFHFRPKNKNAKDHGWTETFNISHIQEVLNVVDTVTLNL